MEIRVESKKSEWRTSRLVRVSTEGKVLAGSRSRGRGVLAGQEVNEEDEERRTSEE